MAARSATQRPKAVLEPHAIEYLVSDCLPAPHRKLSDYPFQRAKVKEDRACKFGATAGTTGVFTMTFGPKHRQAHTTLDALTALLTSDNAATKAKLISVPRTDQSTATSAFQIHPNFQPIFWIGTRNDKFHVCLYLSGKRLRLSEYLNHVSKAARRLFGASHQKNDLYFALDDVAQRVLTQLVQVCAWAAENKIAAYFSSECHLWMAPNDHASDNDDDSSPLNLFARLAQSFHLVMEPVDLVHAVEFAAKCGGGGGGASQTTTSNGGSMPHPDAAAATVAFLPTWMQQKVDLTMRGGGRASSAAGASSSWASRSSVAARDMMNQSMVDSSVVQDEERTVLLMWCIARTAEFIFKHLCLHEFPRSTEFGNLIALLASEHTAFCDGADPGQPRLTLCDLTHHAYLATPELPIAAPSSPTTNSAPSSRSGSSSRSPRGHADLHDDVTWRVRGPPVWRAPSREGG